MRTDAANEAGEEEILACGHPDQHFRSGAYYLFLPHENKTPVFILADRGTGDRYVVPAKTADESTIRLLLVISQQESLTIYTDSFRAYEPLNEDNAFDREYVVHGNSEYVDGDVHVNTCESHRGISKDELTPYLRAFSCI